MFIPIKKITIEDCGKDCPNFKFAKGIFRKKMRCKFSNNCNWRNQGYLGIIIDPDAPGIIAEAFKSCMGIKKI